MDLNIRLHELRKVIATLQVEEMNLKDELSFYGPTSDEMLDDNEADDDSDDVETKEDFLECKYLGVLFDVFASFANKYCSDDDWEDNSFNIRMNKSKQKDCLLIDSKHLLECVKAQASFDINPNILMSALDNFLDISYDHNKVSFFISKHGLEENPIYEVLFQ